MIGDACGPSLRLAKPRDRSSISVCIFSETASAIKINKLIKPDEQNSDIWSAECTAAGKCIQRQFKVKNCNVDTNCYFLLTSLNNSTLNVMPVSHYQYLEPLIESKGNSNAMDEDIVQNRLDKKLEMIMEESESRQNKDSRASDISYITSALSLTNVRKERVNWDFDEEEEDEDADFGDQEIEKPERLSAYGQKVKSLLKQQVNQEVDDELMQYDDDKNDGSPSSSIAGSTASKQSSAIDEMQNKVIRVIRQNMGRMPIKLLLDHFQIKTKNNVFKAMQDIIKKTCTVGLDNSRGQPIKIVTLKAEFYTH